MPRATTEQFSRAHQPSVKGSSSATEQYKASPSASNPLFNTERFGQHILRNPQIADLIVEKANLRPTDKVLEVGPGTGNLTVRILEKAKEVTAIEMDPRMAAELLKRVQGNPMAKRLHAHVGDFVKAELPHFDVCISNTPYQISSPLVFRLLSHRPLCRVAILMFQHEFAMRLVAQPGSTLWSRLSANVQLYAKVDHIRKVQRNNFRPAPQVESSIVRLVPIDPPPPVAFEEFDGLTRLVFSRRNKTVHGNIMAKNVLTMMEKNWRTWCSVNNVMADTGTSFQQEVARVLAETEFAQARAAKMSVDDLLKLLFAFHEIGVHFA